MDSKAAEQQLRGLIARAKRTGSKFIVPSAMMRELIKEAAAGDELAKECLTVVVPSHQIPVVESELHRGPI